VITRRTTRSWRSRTRSAAGTDRRIVSKRLTRGTAGPLGPAAFETATSALRWVTDAAVAADGGAAWPLTRAPGAPLADDLYDGTAGVLVALAEARLSGITEFDEHGHAAAGRLGCLIEAGSRDEPSTDSQQPGHRTGSSLYFGTAGYAASLHMWASVSGDTRAAQAALGAARGIAQIVARGHPVSDYRDVALGEAGVLLALLQAGHADVRPAVVTISGRLAGAARWVDDEPDWYTRDDIGYFLPNFSHGAAGIGYALGCASAALERPDLLQLAASAGRRLMRLGASQEGTLAVPHSIPLADPDAPVSYGWCHGPTGTLRLFQLLDRLQPGNGWADQAEACRRAVRASGLPARLFPGFWDNLGQCCGTAGVGEMALDRYQETGDAQWLAWAGMLAEDVLDRCIADQSGARWSHTEHALDPPELEPAVGWMQGAAGIAGWLLRLARVERDGPSARRISWPDRPAIAPDPGLA
jgi:lantibiotic modifying enzyme